MGKITPATPNKAKRENVYRDFDLSFEPNALTGDIGLLTDETAIKRSLQNILFTRFGQRGFVPGFGSNVASLLFEPVDFLVASVIQAEIVTSCKLEPRVNVISVVVRPDFEIGQYDISITYKIKAMDNKIDTVKFFLKRIR